MLRYFVAVPLPDDSRDLLLTLQPSLIPGMRLIGRQELHLTLHFLGELAAASKEAVHRALENITMNAFTITIRGFGTFPMEGSPKVLWSRVEGGPDLLALHHAVGTALTNTIGFQVEERPYSPHITLARLNGFIPLDFIEDYLSENQGFHVPSIRIMHFALYSSRFVDGIPQYQEEAVFDLS
jgi:2'-5' RNA ligase